jgi:hypothetical protein
MSTTTVAPAAAPPSALTCPDPGAIAQSDWLTLWPPGPGQTPLITAGADTQLAPSAATGRIPAAAITAYLASSGVRTATAAGQDLGAAAAADAADAAALQAEFCWYEARYAAALRAFLTAASAGSGTDNATTAQLLAATVTLNQRLNALLELATALAAARVPSINSHTASVNASNAAISARLATLTQQRDMLTRGNAVMETRREQLRFAGEKNRAMSKQVALFVALDVLALGALAIVWARS